MDNFRISDDDRKNAVYEVQHYLRFLSKHIHEIPTITPDGIYGPETEEAVKAFQRLYSLPVTGEVDYDTWNLIRDTHSDVREDKEPPNPIYIFPVEIVAMKLGDEYNEILILQAIIQKLASRYPNVLNVPVTGSFDNDTELAVKQLQDIFGFENNGMVDRKTWNRLAALYSAFSRND